MFQVMRRQKTPQKQDGRVTESSSAAAVAVVTDAVSVTAATSPAAPAAAAAASTEPPLVDISCSASPAVTPACPVSDDTTKSKTPQTRKSRSRIAANFGALNSQS